MAWILRVLLVVCPAGVSHGQLVDAAVLDRLKTAAPASWKRLEDGFRGISCRGHKIERMNDGSRTWEQAFFFHSSPRDRQYLIVNHTPDWATETDRIGINPRYTFEIQALAGQSTRWSLCGGGPVPGAFSLGQLTKAMADDANVFLQSMMVHTFSVEDLFSDPAHFELMECQEAPDGRVCCVFRCHHPLPAFSDHSLRIVLDPDLDWAIVERVKISASGKEQRFRCDYQTGPNGGNFIHHATIERGDAATGDTAEFEFSDLQPCRVATDEFALPFYGISEAAVLPAKPAGDLTWYLLVIVGTALLITGLVLRRSSKA